MNSKFKQERMRIVIILILIIISCLLIYSIEVILRTSILVAHFFYFPSILACLWWKKKGLIVPIFLATILIICHLILDYGVFTLETINNFLRGISLVVEKSLQLLVKVLVDRGMLHKQIVVNLR